MIKQYYFKQFNLACNLFTLSLNVKQFYLNHRFQSKRQIEYSGATIPGQSRPGSEDNEGVLHILQSSPFDSPSAEIPSVHFTARADWAEIRRVL